MQTYQDIAVVCSRYDQWGAYVACAAGLAARHDARLTGLYLRWPTIGGGVMGMPELAEEMLRRAEADLAAARKAEPGFLDFTRRQGAKRASWLVAEGHPPSVVSFVGAYHDLVVLEGPAADDGLSRGFVEEIVLESRLPCLLVPPAQEVESSTFDHIAIGWNGSVEALRAIHSALPLLARARRVVLLCGEQREYAALIPRKPYCDIDGWLRDHGVQVAQRLLEPERGVDDGKALLAAAKEVNADLLVMGAYGHNRLREWVLGGTTRHALLHSRIALFMQH